MFLGVGNYGFKVFFDAPVRIADLVQARVEKVLEEEEEVPSSCVRKKKASPLSPSLLLLQHQFSPKSLKICLSLKTHQEKGIVVV